MVHIPVTGPRAEYISMLREGKSTEAYEFLLNNPKIIDDMKISEVAGDYQKFFGTAISIARLSGLTRILKERVLGEAAREVFP